MKRFGLALCGLLAIAWIGWQDIPGEFLQRPRTRLSDFGTFSDGDAAFSRAKTALLAAKQYELIVDVGDWQFDSPIDLAPGMILKGEGWNSKIIYEGSSYAVGYDDECVVENLSIIGNASPASEFSNDEYTSGSIGLKPLSTDPTDYDRVCVIRRVNARYFEAAAQVSFNGVIGIYDCYLRNSNKGLHFAGESDNAINVLGGEIRNNAYGIYDNQNAGSTIAVRTVTIEDNSLYGIYKAPFPESGASPARPCIIEGCFFEANDHVLGGPTSSGLGADIYMGSQWANLTITNNVFFTTTTHIDIVGGLGGICENNYFSGGTNSVRLGGAARGWRVRHNTIPSGMVLPQALNTGHLNEFDNTPFLQVSLGGNNDDTDELQAWLDANPKVCVMPAGTYSVSATLVPTDGCRIIGEGNYATILRPISGTTVPLIALGTDCTLENVQLLGRDEASSTGIKPGSGKLRWRIQNCLIRDFADGVLVDSTADDGTLDRCYITSCLTNGISVTSNASGFQVLDCTISSNGGQGISISQQIANMVVRSCYLASNTNYGINNTAATVGLVLDSNQLLFHGTADVILQTAASQGTLVTGNRMNSSPICLSVAGGASGTIIDGNRFGPVGGSTKSIVIGTAIRTDVRKNYYSTGAYDHLGGDNGGTATRYQGQISDTAAPSSSTWERGEIIYNSNPGTSGVTPYAWICSTAGTAGVDAVFQPLYRGLMTITGSTTWDPGSLATGASESKDVTISGGAVGAVALAGLTSIESGMTLNAVVTSSTNVRVTITNVNSSNPKDIGSGTVTVQVFQ